MVIGGLQKTTLIDFPKRVAATVFTVGCNFRCQYCYNTTLALPNKVDTSTHVTVTEFWDFIKKRKNILDGICITGGEPTLHNDLPDFIRILKKYGLEIKLDTNGTSPKMIQNLLDKKMVDYIAMDIKAPLGKYEEITQNKKDLKNIEKSVEIIKNSDIEYEFRTTVMKPLLSKQDIIKIGKWLNGAKLYKLQQCDLKKDIINPKYKGKPSYTIKELEDMHQAVKKYFAKCELLV